MVKRFPKRKTKRANTVKKTSVLCRPMRSQKCGSGIGDSALVAFLRAQTHTHQRSHTLTDIRTPDTHWRTYTYMHRDTPGPARQLTVTHVGTHAHKYSHGIQAGIQGRARHGHPLPKLFGRVRPQPPVNGRPGVLVAPSGPGPLAAVTPALAPLRGGSGKVGSCSPVCFDRGGCNPFLDK